MAAPREIEENSLDGTIAERKSGVNRWKETRNIELQPPCGAPAIGARLAKKDHHPVAGAEHAFADPAGIRVVDEDRLEHPLLVLHQQVMHDVVAKVRGKHFARLRSVGDETHRAPRAVGAIAQGRLKIEQFGLRVELEGEGVDRIALVAAAATIMVHQRPIRKNVRVDQRPPRTARA